MIEHWDGARWSAITSLNVGTKDNSLNGIAVDSSNDVWAVGSYLDTKTTYHQTLTEQWNGTSWNSANFIGYGAADNYLYGVTSIPGTNQAWSVGYFVGSINLQTLTEFYC